ncbi:hypothetical protein K461DRAFT_18184 [Myriangium duriaei CBS 260.36]|uniref:Centromere protein S n=1 Tax=Myriangium duriaei CBS 260.36 TaxID=1168546 RepID=A0A9P4JD31_9PEZI|nr:hypothetical protein K461DRAFT_18184 [Myriangium duriaei CBS 260.36]
MSTAPQNKEEKIERLKSALWHSIGQTIDAIAAEQDVNATAQFMGALTELVWTVVQNASLDTEAFMRHAGRQVIDVQDVLLLARRNDSLKQLLQAPTSK